MSPLNVAPVPGQVVSVRALQQLRLPEIVRRGLRDQVIVRRQIDDDRTTTGVGAEDLVPLAYLLARAAGDDPTKAVAEDLHLSRSAAAQRVARARKSGRIPPATKQGARR